MQNQLPIHVLLVTESDAFRDAARKLVDSHGDIRLIAGDRVESGQQGNDSLRRPDIAVVDVHGVGFEPIVKLSHGNVATRVIAVSEFEFDDYIKRLMEAGASACILRSSLSDDLLPAIRRVAAGEYYFSSAIAKVIIDIYVNEALKRPELESRSPKGEDMSTP